VLQAKLDEAIESPLKARADDFVKAYVYNANQRCLPADGGPAHACGEGAEENQLSVECASTLLTRRIVSISCNSNESIGPPHSLHKHFSFDFALAGGTMRLLPLGDILAHQASARPRLARRVAARLAWDARDVERDLGDFFLTPSALVVTFPEGMKGGHGQVFEVELPYSELDDLLAPNLEPAGQD
jgi:hypothetical protein